MQDIKKFKRIIYNEITDEIWLKIYAIISISFIHLIWLFSILFLNYDDKNIIYGISYYLLIPYLIYIIADFKKNNTIASEKINKYLNYLMTIYLILIIIIVFIPNNNKKNFINSIKNIFKKYL
jgi:hypothetical protein